MPIAQPSSPSRRLRVLRHLDQELGRLQSEVAVWQLDSSRRQRCQLRLRDLKRVEAQLQAAEHLAEAAEAEPSVSTSSVTAAMQQLQLGKQRAATSTRPSLRR